ncbi:hypothetical protein AVEN_49115-1 [Araneus ventricosus]|uniref:Uncharacterized protein n=1 Tax=Araneus ventricosus TaxID=182803 RepID=A0A4Y2BZV0_ARAVE|nr:hypothetical protein AVEN_49115-1 [Araneus ventricosus]
MVWSTGFGKGLRWDSSLNSEELTESGPPDLEWPVAGISRCIRHSSLSLVRRIWSGLSLGFRTAYGMPLWLVQRRYFFYEHTQRTLRQGITG